MIVLVITCIFGSVSAIETSVLLGGGLNSSSPTSALGKDSTYKNRLGWNAGILSEVTFGNQYISIQTGAQLETRGYNQTVSKFDSIAQSINIKKSDLYFTYLYLPLLLQGNLHFSKFRFSLFAGPTLGILMSSKEKIGFEFEEELDDLNNFDWAGTGGLGLEWLTPRGALYIRPEYTVGFSNTLENNGVKKMKHKNIKLQLGFRYFL